MNGIVMARHCGRRRRDAMPEGELPIAPALR
jgi:hypothetical protein